MRRWTVLVLASAIALPAQAPAFAQAANPHAGHAMGGMAAAGMTPPPPIPPPAGAVLALDAAAPNPLIAVRGSPGQITVAFGKPVIVGSLTLTNAVGQQIPTRMTLPVEPVQSVRFPVVIPLQPGAYQLAWRAADPNPPAHGSFSFQVASPDGSAPQPMQMMHHH